MELSFIVIDDSELDCFIARKMIEQAVKSADIKNFLSATDALNNIAANTVANSSNPIIVLVDLMMPKMNGFQFIEAFELLEDKIREKYFITFLTSSMNRNDMNRLNTYGSIQMIFDKPITSAKIHSIIEKAVPGFDISPAG